MAFRLKNRRSLAGQLGDLVDDELRSALGELARPLPDEEAIHEARKSVKRIRALLRLVRDGLGADFAVENKRLRDAAHHLASLRDADATSETLQALRLRYSAVLTPAVARSIERGLQQRRRQARAGASNRIVRVARALQRSSRFAPDQIRIAGRPATIRAGLERGYRRARAAMRRLGPWSDATQFHLWRRRVKDHYYQMRLFEDLHSAPRSRAVRLERLETWLGRDHDLAILRATILGGPHRFGEARQTALVLGCITKYQQSLRGRSLAFGRRLFAPTPQRFGSSTGAWL